MALVVMVCQMMVVDEALTPSETNWALMAAGEELRLAVGSRPL